MYGFVSRVKRLCDRTSIAWLILLIGFQVASSVHAEVKKAADGVVVEESQPSDQNTEGADENKDAGENSGTGDSSDKGEWAARAKAAGMSRAHLDPESSRLSALFNELNEREKIWLDSPADDARFLAVGIKEASAVTKGAVIVVPDYGQHAQWPMLVKPLTQVLPDKGWYAFALSVPSLTIEHGPARKLPAKTIDEITVAEEQSPSTETSGDSSKDESVDQETEGSSKEGDGEKAASAEEAPKEVAEDIAEAQASTTVGGAEDQSADESSVAIDLGDGEINTETDKDSVDGQAMNVSALEIAGSRLFASIQYVKSLGYDNVVLIGYGAGATHVMGYLEANKGSLSGQGMAVILVDADLGSDDYAVFDKSLTKGMSLPFLDMVNSQNLEKQRQGKARLRAARSLQLNGFQQAKTALSNSLMQETESLVMSRIAGWLDKWVWQKKRRR